MKDIIKNDCSTIFTKNGKALKVYFDDNTSEYAEYFEVESKVDSKNSRCHSTVRFKVNGVIYLKKYDPESDRDKFYVVDSCGNILKPLCLESNIIDVSFVDVPKTADDIYNMFHSESKTPDASNRVNHPSHYNQGGIEVWDVISAFTKDLEGAEAFYAGNVIKYVLRWNHKNGIEDLEKAKVYIDKLIESRKGEKSMEQSQPYGNEKD